MTCLSLDSEALDLLMPLHLRLSREGSIEGIGPTLARICPPPRNSPAEFFKEFSIVRPPAIRSMFELRAVVGTEVRLRSKRTKGLPDLRGLPVHMSGGSLLLNLSFGLGLIDSVARFDLTQTDFAATDLAIEMLYLFEAKSALMDESRRLNLHLDDARSSAVAEAQTDKLTGLGNRRALDQSLERALSLGVRLAVIQIDLDYFKQVNDTHGHAAGDRTLAEVAKILRTETRRHDFVARIGGDEFVVVVTEPVDRQILQRMADRVIARIEEPIPFESVSLGISASCGIKLVEPGELSDAESLLAAADDALYRSKRAGRGQASFSTDVVAGGSM